MKNSKRLLLTAVCVLAFAAPAASKSVEIIPDTALADQHSIIHAGKPLDCAVDDCPKEEVAAPAKEKGHPLVDAFGMPTRMPTVLRGGQSSDDVVVAAPKPAATEAAPASGTPAAKTDAPAKAK